MMRLQLGVGLAFVISGLGAAVGCTSSTNSPDAGADASSDACMAANLSDIAMNCPSDSSGNQLNYTQASETTCGALKMKVGFIRAGQCTDYLVWSVFPDPAHATVSDPSPKFTECFYDPITRKFTVVYFADGSGADQCGGSSATVQAGALEAWCNIAAYDINDDCAPKPDAGTD